MTYYEILEVSINASDEVIKTAYKTLAKKYHPDVYNDDKIFAEQQMKLINTAYEVLSNERKRKEYDVSINIFRAETKKPKMQTQVQSETTFSYLGNVLCVSVELANVTTWTSSFIKTGLISIKNFIHCYKAITKYSLGVESTLGSNIRNIGFELIKHHVDLAFEKYKSILVDYGIVDSDELQKARNYLDESIVLKLDIDTCFSRYFKYLEEDCSSKLCDANLSKIAYYIYSIYCDVAKEMRQYLEDRGLIKLPLSQFPDFSCFECESAVRKQKILKGDLLVLEKLFNCLLIHPENVECYCLLYYLYGDPKNELDQVADYFGVKEAYVRCREAYIQNEFMVKPECLFISEATANYSYIYCSIANRVEHFTFEYIKREYVPNLEKYYHNANLKGSINEYRRCMYSSKTELLEMYCDDKEDMFNSMYIIYAASALLSMHFDELSEGEYIAWVDKSHKLLRKYLLEYYEDAKKTIKNISSSSCFITTAVCSSFGKPDNCYELQSFRWFRDCWLSKQSDGEELISEYYNVAPMIVKQINRRVECKKIYKSIWHEYLSQCLKYIEDKEFVKCKELYTEMVCSLKFKYINDLRG